MLMVVIETEARLQASALIRLLFARADNCLWPVHVAIASLKFGLQFDGKPRKIDKIPSREVPRRFRRSRCSFVRRMLKSNDEMHRVVANFIRRFLRLEIKRAETAVTTAGDVKAALIAFATR